MMITQTNIKQRVSIAICALLSTITLITFVYALQQWHSDWTLTRKIIAPPSLSSNAENSAIIMSIPHTHLFGEASTKLGNMPITNLQLHVTAIIKINNDPEHSWTKAYISIAGQPSKAYRIGDELPYGVKVYDITSYAVILENDGHLEKLPLPREPLQFKAKISETI